MRSKAELGNSLLLASQHPHKHVAITRSEVLRPPSPLRQSAQSIVILLATLVCAAHSAVVAAATLTFYTDRPTFQAAAGSLTTESFENGYVDPTGNGTLCTDPYDSTTDDLCWNPNDVAPGLSIGSLSGQGVSIVGPVAGGNTSIITLATHGDVDSLKVMFEGGTLAAGMDISGYLGAGTATFKVYGEGNVLLSTQTPAFDATGKFYGVISSVMIDRIELSSGKVPEVDNVSFGPTVNPDLAIQLSGAESPPGTVIFTVTAQNLGPPDATGVISTLAFPPALAYVSDDCGGSGATQPWTWNLGGLTNGSQAVCHVTTSVVTAQGLVAIAKVLGDHPSEILLANNKASVSLSVTGTGPETSKAGFALFRSFYDLAYKDQTGAPFSLRNNADKVILVQICAVWCSACHFWSTLSPTLKQTVDQNIGAGHFLDVDMLVESNSSGPSSQTDATHWVTQNSFVGTVLHSESSTTSPLYQLSVDLSAQYDAVPAQRYVPEFFILAPDCDNQIAVRAYPSGSIVTPPLAEQALVDTSTADAMANLITDVWNQRPCTKPLEHRLDRCSVGYAPILSVPSNGKSIEAAEPLTVAAGQEYDIGAITAVTDAPIADFTVYNDAAGIPASTVCSSSARPGSAIYSPSVQRFTLDTPCKLGPGSYWMSLQGRSSVDAAPFNWFGGYLAPIGSYFVRDVQNTLGTSCTNWTSAGTCVASQQNTQLCFILEDFLFKGGFETSGP
jgi:uncharacterized repeat protein (TIGR01451 family)